MSDRDVSWKGHPLVREVGSLCPRLPAPEQPKKSASETKVKLTEEAEIPDQLKIPDTPAKLLDSETYRWPCWACRIKFLAKKDDKLTTSTKGPKNRLRGIEDRAVQEFIIKAELRRAKIDTSKLFEEKPEKHKPIVDIDNLDPFSDTVMTAPEGFEEIWAIHPLGSMGDVETWFGE
ncbi:hypothetical protein FVEN_g827 [Fusarium venenatum]|uniref:uncharacterized protein n=1 Tax=Fusarium venenatum TaxID=56646 RepID=UPI001D4D876D|nr:hypothetical protein FVEN_g827 [Fusarium venenatum]KAH6967344.1 hypothetical protein EDB82DRAFT_563155 [Fusarium venenatum]